MTSSSKESKPKVSGTPKVSKTKEPINRHYVSELDRFLEAFDKRPGATSASRRAEEKKYAKVFLLRDKADAEPTQKIWENF